MAAEQQAPEKVAGRTTDVVVRLSVDQLQELIDRAEGQNYLITQSTDDRWVRIIPHATDEP